MSDKNEKPTENKVKPQKPQKNFLFKSAIAIALVAAGWYISNIANEPKVNTVPETFTSLVQKIDSNKVSKLTLTASSGHAKVFEVQDKLGNKYPVVVPTEDNDILVTKALKNDIPLITVPPSSGIFMTLFTVWGPVLLLCGIIIWSVVSSRRAQGAMRMGMGDIVENKTKLINPNEIQIGFDDVIGCDGAKEEVREVIDFLKDPERFTNAGAKIPRGLLLVGPAGTGKTMLAKAIAKESNVPFYSTSGSEFVEMFVGVGAARVRSMFENAKEKAPCILFIDEIDSIGGKRGMGGPGNGNSEREQTLNQILVELDGLDKNKTVILIAATNRPETLDDALLRPGRIDRQINVDLPDVKGREEMLKLYSKQIRVYKDVKFANIALGTPGFSGAELANLVNEATILAVRANSEWVKQEHFEEAKSKIMMGLERPNLSMTEKEKEETAYHEAGHAIIARLLADNNGSDPVYKVTIIPRGRALGLTVQLPEKERYSYDMNYVRNRITILMGGRAAEEIFCNKRTSGASNDIQVATSMAQSMVCEWGMSKLGPLALGSRQGNMYLSGSEFKITATGSIAEEAQNEINKIINDEYEHAVRLLNENADIMENMKNALMEIETIEEWHIDNLMARRHYADKIGLDEYEKRYNKKFVKEKDHEDIIDGETLISNLSQKDKKEQVEVKEVQAKTETVSQ